VAAGTGCLSEADNANPNLFLDDLASFPLEEIQQAIVGLARSGVEENFRLDFKERWEPDKQCPDIVAYRAVLKT